MRAMDWAAWAIDATGATFGGLVILWLVGGYYHLRYYVRRAHEPEAWKIQPKRFLRPGQAREAMLLSSFNLTLGGVISGTFIYALRHGLSTPIYFDVADHGWAYTLLSPVLYFVLVDALAYYGHRALHGRWLFRKVHRHHHRFLAPTPFVVVAMHPVELLVFQALSFLPLFIMPVHYLGAIVVLVYVLVFNIIDHSGVRLRSRWPWQGPSMYHDDHHTQFHCNFGQHLMLWDRLHGTLRRIDRRYGKDVFGGKGAARDGAPAAGFVRY